MLLCIFLLGHPPAFGVEIEATGTPVRKLQRGFLNVVLSPIEIAEQMSVEERRSLVEPTWAFGFMRGTAYMVGRTLIGIYEMLSFPLPLPANYEPVVEPEFLWQHFEHSETSA
ncbi:MAG TPA: exosortase system-associated protein, TIGR04073 family [Candidatus Omnitrophota bacterium]|nr:exosortase system-associated protein, TIGR04073 family [Candidatus Omnitrophota bacterium]